MIYRYLATSPEGFVQQLATCYLTHGYYFFVQGVVPPGKDPRQVDRKLLEKYEIALTSAQRYYRKRQGLASIHYLRYEYHWIMVATHGRPSVVGRTPRRGSSSEPSQGCSARSYPLPGLLHQDSQGEISCASGRGKHEREWMEGYESGC